MGARATQLSLMYVPVLGDGYQLALLVCVYDREI